MLSQQGVPAGSFGPTVAHVWIQGTIIKVQGSSVILDKPALNV